MMLFCAALGYLVARYGLANAPGISKSTLLILLLLIVPFFLIVIAFHEMGHAIAGVMVNFDFRMYVVGPFMWSKEQEKWKFSWNKNVNTAGGLVLCLPTDTQNLTRRFCGFALGGPLASLLLAVVCLLAAQRFTFEVATVSVPLQVLKSSFYVLSVFSFLIFLVTIIPMHTGGFSSDGARALRLLRGGDAARFEVLLLKLITQSAAGTRPRLLNLEEMKEALQLADQLAAPYGIYLHSYFHQAAWDRGEIEQAEEHLLEYINGANEIPAGIRNTVWLDASFFYAFAKKNLVEAEKYWSRFKATAMIPKAQVFATEAALYYEKNEHEMAKLKIAAALRELPNMMDKGIALPLQERLVDMQKSMEHS